MIRGKVRFSIHGFPLSLSSLVFVAFLFSVNAMDPFPSYYPLGESKKKTAKNAGNAGGVVVVGSAVVGVRIHQYGGRNPSHQRPYTLGGQWR